MPIELKNLSEKLHPVGILPTLCPENQEETDTLLQAIEKTPISALEITLRHPYALHAIERIKQICPSIRVGAGTVLDLPSLHKAIDAGADFCVSPGLHETLLAEAQTCHIPFLPGCATPSEIQHAAFLGIRTVKFFPAECSGGPKALKLYEGAFKDISFLPTGGITAENLSSYLRCPNVFACGGSFMVDRNLLKSGDSAKIREKILHCINIRKDVST